MYGNQLLGGIIGLFSGLAVLWVNYPVVDFLRKYLDFNVNDFDPIQHAYYFCFLLIFGAGIWVIFPRYRPFAIGLVSSYPIFSLLF
jgi:hypothetical protein